jgi:hypothetical protein
MLRTALVENVMQLEHVGKKAAKEVQQVRPDALPSLA